MESAALFLEEVLQSELHDARIFRRCDLAKISAVQVNRRIVLDEAVRYVERFRTELHADSLCNLDLLVHPGFPGHKRRTDKSVTAEVADAAETRCSKEPVRTAAVGLAIGEIRTPAVGPLVMARAEVVGGCVRAVVALVVKNRPMLTLFRVMLPAASTVAVTGAAGVAVKVVRSQVSVRVPSTPLQVAFWPEVSVPLPAAKFF